MNKTHEKLLVATLAGLIIASAAAFAVQPAMAQGYDVDRPARVTGVQSGDMLNVRRWPASYSQRVGRVAPNSTVWVERCIVSPQGGADWCLIEQKNLTGWVNSRYIRPLENWDR